MESETRSATRLVLANALSTLGRQRGNNGQLLDAISEYREALKERPREGAPLDWVITQDNLGSALRSLGERESGTARLEEAVAAHRAALEEYTRERVPLNWATAQNKLGTALRMLGERESEPPASTRPSPLTAWRSRNTRGSGCRCTGR